MARVIACFAHQSLLNILARHMMLAQNYDRSFSAARPQFDNRFQHMLTLMEVAIAS